MEPVADVTEVPPRDEDMDPFIKGARAMFDHLMFKVANNWNCNPEIDKKCQEENDIITDWADDALRTVSPSSSARWKRLTDLERKIWELKSELAKLREEKANGEGKKWPRSVVDKYFLGRRG